MTTVIVAIRGPRARALAAELAIEGITVVDTVDPLSPALPSLLSRAEALLVPAERSVLTTGLLAECDRAGVHVVALGDGGRALGRLPATTALPADATAWQVSVALAEGPRASAPRASATGPRVTAVWGPHGAPGRSTIAVQLAAELVRRGRRTVLVDADTVAPALALLLAVSDDAPGVAAACRRAELGGLDATELRRLASVVATSGGDLDVLPGINRPGRWAELSSTRLAGALRACRSWAEETVVDVAAAFDADDEATYDLTGPRRHAATTAALVEADRIVAVAAADPVGISRFLRDHAELRRLTSPTPIRVVVNRVRSGPLGVDARGQIRRTLERFAGIDDITFLPFDQRAADAMLLHARVMADLVPRSPLPAAIRGLVGSLLPAERADGMPATAGSSRGSSRGARRPR